MSLFHAALQPALDSDGNPISGATWNFYRTTTTTPQSVYSNAALSVSLGSTVTADSAGRFANIFLDDTTAYRAVLKTAGGATIKDIDPVNPGENGADDVGFLPSGAGAVSRTVQDKLRDVVSVKDFGAVGDGVTDDSAAIQAALNAAGGIYIPPGTYRIETTLKFKGNTELFGAGPGISILKWYGANSGNILEDTSVSDNTKINLNVVMRDFEIDGNSYVTGTTGGLICYRVGNAIFDNLYIHHCGSSLLRWGYSQADTRNILVSRCRLEYARSGDACQGVGTNVTINKCIAFSAGDTAFALLYDFSATTNPIGLYSSNITFDGCIAKGEYNSSGTYTGSGNTAQTGFAIGPFDTDVNAYVTMRNCICESLYVNVWHVAFNHLAIEGCYFKQASALDTGGVRLDGIRNLKLINNTFENGLTSASIYFSSLFINAGRFTYGASNFDASSVCTKIVDNLFLGAANEAIIFACDPSYATIERLTVSGNTFSTHALPIQFLPVSGSGTGIFKDILVSANIVDASATLFVTATGAASQYDKCAVLNNQLGSVLPTSATDGALQHAIVQGSYISNISAASGAATTVFTMPSVNYRTMQITSYVAAASGAFTAIAVIINNYGSPRIAWQSNGANMTLALSGNDVQATQTTGGTNTIYTNVTYLS